MKILFISWFPPSPVGSGFYLDLVYAMMQAGHQVKVVSQGKAGVYDEFDHDAGDFPVYRLPFEPSSSIPVPTDVEQSLVSQSLDKLLNESADNIPDLVIFGHEYWLWYVDTILKYKFPFVVNLRGLPTRLIVEESYPAAAAARFLELLRLAVHIFSVNKTFKSYLVRQEFQDQSITTIDNGIDLSLFNPISIFSRKRALNSLHEARIELSIPLDHKLIVNVSLHYPHKRVMNFVKAALLILEGREDITFVLIGHGPESDRIFTAINESKYSDRFLIK